MADAPTAAPNMYSVVLENDRVRVLEIRGSGGENTPLHTHPAMVAIALTDGSYRFGDADGHSMEAELKAGQAMYLDAVEHTTEITSSGEVRALLVELK